MSKKTYQLNDGFSVEIERHGEPVWVDYTYNQYGTGFGWKHLKTEFTVTTPDGVRFQATDTKPGPPVSRWGLANVHYTDLQIKRKGDDEFVLVTTRQGMSNTMDSRTGSVSSYRGPEEPCEFALAKLPSDAGAADENK